MTRETAEVIKSLPEGLVIRPVNQSKCSLCPMSRICTSIDNSLYIPRSSKHHLKCGDKIEVEIDEKKANLASIIMFLMPIIIFVVVVSLLHSISAVAGFLIALGTVLLYYFIIRLVLKRKGSYFHIRIIRKL